MNNHLNFTVIGADEAGNQGRAAYVLIEVNNAPATAIDKPALTVAGALLYFTELPLR